MKSWFTALGCAALFGISADGNPTSAFKIGVANGEMVNLIALRFMEEVSSF